MKILKENILELEQELIELRKDIHMHPELQWEEKRTTELVIKHLEAVGIECRRIDPTGVVADLKGSKPGKTIALRADMDALSVQELNTELEYKSKEDGKMHACGHDSHTAMLICAAKALAKQKDDICGTVRFLFQPAEEIAQGAKEMVKQGAMDGVDHVFGIHIWSDLDTGKIACPTGPSFASADIFTVELEGKGGHGALPHQCVDTAVMTSSYVMNLQSIVSREISPIDPAVVTVGKMEVGTRFNIIAQFGKVEGTVRCFSNDTKKHIEDALERYAKSTIEMYGGTGYKVDYTYGTIVVENDTQSALMVQDVIKESFGEQSLATVDPITGGEDFSYFTECAPGSFALVGCRNEKIGANYPHHHGLFNVDNESLKYGAELYAQVAMKYLNN